MTRLLLHLRLLWGAYWPLPGGLPLLYVLLVASLGDLRIDHLGVLVLSGTLAYFNRRTRRFFLDVLPYLVVAIGYDALRYPLRLLVTPERVVGCQIRDLELALFSAAPGVTFQDWFASHHSPLFDLVFAAPYLLFIYIVFGYAVFLYFVDRHRMRRFLWAFAVGNFIAFAIWMALPTAPPWYVRGHGCVIDTATRPSAAALLRVDALLSVDYFHAFYARGAQVFGAFPSMHCAYPVMGLLTAWKTAGWRTRPVHVVYAAWMAVAAVYLDHHWVLDVLAGWLLAAVAVWIAGKVVDRLYHPELARTPSPWDEGRAAMPRFTPVSRRAFQEQVR